MKSYPRKGRVYWKEIKGIDNVVLCLAMMVISTVLVALVTKYTMRIIRETEVNFPILVTDKFEGVYNGKIYRYVCGKNEYGYFEISVKRDVYNSVKEGENFTIKRESLFNIFNSAENTEATDNVARAYSNGNKIYEYWLRNPNGAIFVGFLPTAAFIFMTIVVSLFYGGVRYFAFGDVGWDYPMIYDYKTTYLPNLIFIVWAVSLIIYICLI